MLGILVDAGPLIALFDKDDGYHERIKRFIGSSGGYGGRGGKGYKFITTTAVLTEVSHMLDFSVYAQIDFFTWVMNRGVILWEIGQEDMARIIELTTKYRDRPMDFADATLVIAAEKTGVHSIISIDADFDIYRLPGKVMIQNVFREN